MPCRSRWSTPRFRRTATLGRKAWTLSSWKLESSATATSASSTTLTSGGSTFPLPGPKPVGAEEVGGEEGGAGLARGSRDPHDGGGGEAVGELRLPEDLGAPGGEPFQVGVVQGHPGGGHHLLVGFLQVPVRLEAQGQSLPHLLFPGAVVVEAGGKPPFPQEAEDAEAAPSQAVDEPHPPPPKARATAKAVTTAKRKTILASSQPRSSKWWWRGLMRRRRRPVRRK